jgi:hypothetical protein
MRRAQVVQVHMDYLDSPGIRKIRVNLKDETLEADMLGGKLTINGTVHEYPSERDQSYKAMHDAAIKGASPTCSLPEGLAVMDLIDASERALHAKTWISA